MPQLFLNTCSIGCTLLSIGSLIGESTINQASYILFLESCVNRFLLSWKSWRWYVFQWCSDSEHHSFFFFFAALWYYAWFLRFFVSSFFFFWYRLLLSYCECCVESFPFYLLKIPAISFSAVPELDICILLPNILISLYSFLLKLLCFVS